MGLPTTTEMLASLDDELVDLLAERMRLVSALPAPRTAAELEAIVDRMRNLALAYGAPSDMTVAIARALVDEERGG